MDCPICLEIIENNVFTTYCNHLFHKECINKWLSKTQNCPYCRSIIKSNIQPIINNTQTNTQPIPTSTDYFALRGYANRPRGHLSVVRINEI